MQAGGRGGQRGEVVAAQVAAGIDVGNDGEQAREASSPTSSTG